MLHNCCEVEEKLILILQSIPACAGSAGAQGGLDAGRCCCRDRAAKCSPTGLPGGCTAFLGTLLHPHSKLTSTSWPSQRPWPRTPPRRSWTAFHEPFSLPGPLLVRHPRLLSTPVKGQGEGQWPHRNPLLQTSGTLICHSPLNVVTGCSIGRPPDL